MVFFGSEGTEIKYFLNFFDGTLNWRIHLAGVGVKYLYSFCRYTGASGHVLYVLRLRHHDNREALPDPVEDDGHHHVGHGDRSDRIVPITYVLWWPRSPAQVDSLGHDPLRRELVHLFVTSLYLRWTADPSKRNAAQRHRARRWRPRA